MLTNFQLSISQMLQLLKQQNWTKNFSEEKTELKMSNL